MPKCSDCTNWEIPPYAADEPTLAVSFCRALSIRVWRDQTACQKYCRAIKMTSTRPVRLPAGQVSIRQLPLFLPNDKD